MAAICKPCSDWPRCLAATRGACARTVVRYSSVAGRMSEVKIVHGSSTGGVERTSRTESKEISLTASFCIPCTAALRRPSLNFPHMAAQPPWSMPKRSLKTRLQASSSFCGKTCTASLHSSSSTGIQVSQLVCTRYRCSLNILCALVLPGEGAKPSRLLVITAPSLRPAPARMKYMGLSLFTLERRGTAPAKSDTSINASRKMKPGDLFPLSKANKLWPTTVLSHPQGPNSSFVRWLI
mmetsp:Transcript_130523/g.278948  ORF Transcript_130523/g.278948 Transcript_130523/m.278948 type:complete len:238 (+) Transcript_130523:125-838(+)